MKLNKAQEELIKKKVGGQCIKKIITEPIRRIEPIYTTMALGEEGNPPIPKEWI